MNATSFGKLVISFRHREFEASKSSLVDLEESGHIALGFKVSNTIGLTTFEQIGVGNV